MADIVDRLAAELGVSREYAKSVLQGTVESIKSGKAIENISKYSQAPSAREREALSEGFTGGKAGGFAVFDVFNAAIEYGTQKGEFTKSQAKEYQKSIDKARDNYGAMSGLMPGEQVAVSTNDSKFGGLNDPKVIDVILGEALGVDMKGREASFKDMLGIASVISNRANSLGVSPRDVVGPKSQFNGRKASPGMEKHRDLAIKAVEQVMQSGPVHKATFYATPRAKGNLPKGLQRETSTAGHVFFSDPQNRAIRTSAGDRNPNPSAIAASTAPAQSSQFVRATQKQLSELGYSIPIDGKMGPLTRDAVRQFQAASGGLAVDGIAGPRTQAALAKSVSDAFAAGVPEYKRYAQTRTAAPVQSANPVLAAPPPAAMPAILSAPAQAMPANLAFAQAKDQARLQPQGSLYEAPVSRMSAAPTSDFRARAPGLPPPPLDLVNVEFVPGSRPFGVGTATLGAPAAPQLPSDPPLARSIDELRTQLVQQQALLAPPVGAQPAPPASTYAALPDGFLRPAIEGMVRPGLPGQLPAARPTEMVVAPPSPVQPKTDDFYREQRQRNNAAVPDANALDRSIADMATGLPADAVTDGARSRPGIQIGEMMRGLPGAVVGGLLGTVVMGPVGGIIGASLGRGINGGQLGGLLGGILGGGERSAPQGMIDTPTPSSGGFRSENPNTGWTSYTNPKGVTTTFDREGNTLGGPGNSGK